MKQNRQQVVKLLKKLGNEFIVVKNPSYIFSPFDIYPIARANKKLSELKAVVMDMDGTTTTTENICIHSLELMIRRMSNRTEKSKWKGLTHEDYPHIIGNSTTKHVEYLISKYMNYFQNDAVLYWFIYSALWTIKNNKDKKRTEEVMNNLSVLGFDSLLSSSILKKYLNCSIAIDKAVKDLTINILKHISFSKNQLVRIGVDIYYQRYHEILGMISSGKGKVIAKELFGNSAKALIEPMPGVLIFLSLIKGWLDENDLEIIEKVLNHSYSEVKLKKEILQKLFNHFSKTPAKVGLVTSSIFYEADLVMQEVMKVLVKQIRESFFPEKKKIFLENKFSDYRNIYDSFVTASDSSEIRLKPHRDLYSIALHQLNIPKRDFDKVLGLEDSESGTIAIRAAGIGLSVAVPFAETSGHNLSAATFVCHHGLPEVILKHSLFLHI